MNLTVFGIGYVGLVQAAVLAEVGHDVLCVDVDAGQGRGAEGRATSRSTSRGSRTGREEPRRRPAATSPPTPPRPCDTATSMFIAVGTPPDEDGSADLSTCSPWPTTIAEHMDRAQGGRQQVHRAGRHRRQGRARRSPRRWPRRGADRRLRRRLQPRVPQGRRGGRRLHAPRPHHHRHRRPGVRASVLRELYAPFSRNHEKIIVMDVRSGRADQVRRQLHAGDQDQLHERDGQPRRASGRRHRDGAPAASAPTAHRLPLHLSRRRLRRLLLPEGRAGADRAPRARPASSRACCRRSRTVNDAQKHVLFEKISAHYRRRPRGARPSPSGAWPSSPTPTTCARRRAGYCWRRYGHAGARVQAFDPEAMDEAQRIYRRARRPRAAAAPRRRRWRAPTRWSSSPSGRRSAPRTST